MAKVICFHGADHKTGTTQISESCAEYIAAVLSEDVLLINADGAYGLDYYQYGNTDLEIDPSIINDLNLIKQIKDKSFRHNNFYVLNLSSNTSISVNVIPEIIEELITRLKDLFGIIIIDAGCDILSRISLGALFASDVNYFVLTQQESSLRRSEYTEYMYFRLQIVFSRYIINKYSKSSIFDKTYIADRLNKDKSLFLEIHEDKQGFMAEVESKSLFSYKPSKRFVKEIRTLSEEIIQNAGLEIRGVRQKKTKSDDTKRE